MQQNIKSFSKIALAAFFLNATSLHAIVNVTNLNDSGVGSLRQAMLDLSAQTPPSADTIVFDNSLANGTITLTNPLPIIQNFSIQGPAGGQVTIDGQNANPGFLVYTGTVSLSNFRLINTRATGGNGGTGSGGGGGSLGAGAGLFVNSGTTVTISNLSFDNAQAIGGNGGSTLPNMRGGGGGGGLISNGGSAAFIVNSNGGGGGGGLYLSNGGSSTGIGAGGGGGLLASSGGSASTGGGGGGGGAYSSPGGSGGTNVNSGGGGGGGAFNNSGNPGVINNGGAGGGPNGAPPGGNAGIQGGGGGGVPIVLPSGGNGGSQYGGGGGAYTSTTIAVSSGNAVIGGGGGSVASSTGINLAGGSSSAIGGGGGGGATAVGTSGGQGGLFSGGGGGGAGTVGNPGGTGGAGGFGGGGGGAAFNQNTAAAGGFGAGNGGPAATVGGRASGFGGAIFVRSGGTLIAQDGSFNNNSVAAGGIGSGVVFADGRDLYLMDSSSITFDVSETNPVAIFVAGGINEASGGSLVKEGAGTLSINTQGLSSFDGPITVNAGVVNAIGQIASATQVNAGGTLQGTGFLGSINNDGIVAPGNGIGTLSTGTYVQGAGGTLQNEINSGGQTDLLQVTGSATLNGTIDVLPEPGIYFNGQTFTFLNAGGGVTGTFSSLISSNSSLQYQVLYFPNFAQIQILGGGIRPDCVLGGNPGTIRDYLASLPIDPNSELGQDLLNFVGLNCAEFKDALRQLDPSRFGAYDWINASTLSMIRRNLEDRGQPNPCDLCSCNTQSGGIWVSADGGHLQQSRLNSFAPFHANERVYLIGADRWINQDQLVGISGGYSRTHLNWTTVGGRGKISGFHIAPYAAMRQRNWTFDASIIGSVYRLHGDRKINFGNLDLKAKNVHNGTSVFLHIGAAYTLPWCEYVITPLAGVDYLYFHRRAFNERGAGALNYRVDSHTAQFLQGRLGASIARCFNVCGGQFIPRLQASVVSLSPISGYLQEANLRGFSESFSVRNTHKTIVQGAPLVELTYKLRNDVAISALYEGFFANKLQEHSYSATVSWDF